MRIFQPTYTNRKGRKRKSSRYHVSFKDHTGVWRRVTGYTDKQASESLGRKLERLAALRAVHEPLTPELADWLDGIADDLREKLTEWGLVDLRATLASRPLAQHVDDWHDDIINRGKSEAHAELLRARLNRIIEGCGFNRYADITTDRVNRYLADLRKPTRDDDGNEIPGLSVQTVNHYVAAAKQFCSWMVKNGRASDVRLLHLQRGNVETDRRYVRRALTVDEMTRLIRTARASKAIRNGATGLERAIIYQLALETGLRRNEIRTLTRDSFDLDSEKPKLTVKASNTKNRKADVFALQPDLAAALRLHLANKLPTAPAFGIGRYTAKMLHADCADAGIDVGPPTARVDFHGNRTTFITNLGRAGVPLVMAQQLARHSDPRLTANVYTRFDDDEKRAATALLPKLTAAG